VAFQPSGNTGTFELNNAVSSPVSWLALNTDGTFSISSATAYKPGGGSWAASSDDRIKSVTGDYKLGLSEILQLNPIVFTYKGNHTVGSPHSDSPYRHDAANKTPFVGFVAQDLVKIIPEMVSHSDGYIDGRKVTDLKMVDTSSLIYVLVNACKELKQELDALKSHVESL
jgi:hypothetical protein